MAGRGFLLQVQARSLNPAFPFGRAQARVFAELCLPGPDPSADPPGLCFPAGAQLGGDTEVESLGMHEKQDHPSSRWEMVQQSRQEQDRREKTCQHHGVSWEEGKEMFLWASPPHHQVASPLLLKEDQSTKPKPEFPRRRG